MGSICIIGPRDTGKTTYLSCLAYLSHVNKENFEVLGSGRDYDHLITEAENKIFKRVALEPTKPKGVFEIDEVSLTIKLNYWYLSKQSIEFAFLDFSGEIFNDLGRGKINEDYLKKCLKGDITGCLVLLDDWEKGDKQYADIMRNFITQMDKRNRINDLRLAVALSKCERGEIWPGRLEPEKDIFQVYLKNTRNLLRQKIPKKNLRFYALSAFGVLSHNDPRPNRTDELGSNHSVLKSHDINKWCPYNLISPLYWLSTGMRMWSNV